ncbi:DegV family protein [Clostridium cellulovorans]|uniref:DegV family protein n=1 Tax=Clostridium cellulovorans (strain ATCC 35296 / DSM 3052 / OCM 3 / 743B) TaxID=573061 RepID=D9SRW4_CLOC7|nr:DegV family protein [Clostridium cellulovorans]ADL50481.1 degV family protein [Clostridium cellulovorans 743B]
MEKIKIITDSTCDLPKEVIERYDIEVVPLLVTIDNKTYHDGTGINFSELMDKIEIHGVLPTTSQINPQRFSEVYKKYLDQGYKILSIHLSSKMSGTVQSAGIAKDILETEDIEIIDSQNVTSGLGVLVLRAANLRDQGMSIHEIKESVEKLRHKVKSSLMFDKLDNLIKGGRLSKTAGTIGAVLNIKLILEVLEGEMSVKEKVRGTKKAIKSIITDLDKCEVLEGTEVILLSAGANPEAYDALKANLEDNNISYIESEAGCVVGTHSGDGACGYFFIEK